MMKLEKLAVSRINEELAEVHRSNNDNSVLDTKDWSYTRMVSYIPRNHADDYWTLDDRTTEIILVGIQEWDSENGNTGLAGIFLEVYTNEDGSKELSDIDMALGDGPQITTTKMEDLLDWMFGYGAHWVTTSSELDMSMIELV